MRQKPNINLTKWRKLHSVPSNKLLRLKVIEYIENKNWYTNTRQAIKEHFPSDSHLFSSLLACTSQRNSLKVNVSLALLSYEYIKNGSDPLTIDYGIASPSIKGNIKRVLGGSLPSGNKIKPFTLALLGDLSQIVIDSWMVKLFNLKRNTPNKTDIKHMSTIITMLSEEFNLKPSEIQSILWVYAKRELNETNNKDYEDYSFFLNEQNSIKTIGV
jgi:hypothetical protein